MKFLPVKKLGKLIHLIPTFLNPVSFFDQMCPEGRTFPKHPYYSQPLGPGQLSLFNLLKAYSLLDNEVGYCQGLSFVAGILLLHVSIFFFLQSKIFFSLSYLIMLLNKLVTIPFFPYPILILILNSSSSSFSLFHPSIFIFR